MNYNNVSKKEKRRKVLVCLMVSLLLVTFFGSTGSSSFVVEAETPEEVFDDEFEQYIEDFMNYTGALSLVMAFIYDTDIVYVGGFGDQPENETVYQLGGVSRIFTATAIMQLYEDGLIDLETDITNYFPFWIRNPSYPSTTITINHILSYASTIKTTEQYWDKVIDEEYNLTDIFYDFFHTEGSEYGTCWNEIMPGTAYYEWWRASLSYDILAYVVEFITGKNFTQYVHENIFLPLGMENTKLNYNDYNESVLAAPPLIIADHANITVPRRNYDGRGSVGWRTTIEDYTKLLYSFMHGSYNGTSILEQTTIDLMLTDKGDGSGICFSNNMFFVDRWGMCSNVASLPPGSLGSFSVMSFDDEIGAVFLCNTHFIHSELQDDADRFFEFVENSLLRLRPTTTTNSDLLFSYLLLVLIGIFSVVKRKRSKCKNKSNS
jgi:CubicO group peptidase (beta-lactamase class C family)